MTNSEQQNTTQTAKDRGTRNRLKTWVNSDTQEA